MMRVPLVIGLALTCGCESRDEPPYYPVAGCEHVDHAPCDTLEFDCQSLKLAIAACLRGSPAGELPPIRRVSEDAFAQELEALYAEDPPPDPDYWERALVLLGWVPAGAFSVEQSVARNAAEIYGVYRSTTKEVVLIDHGEPADDVNANVVLVHELIHALQDRDLDLERFWDDYSLDYDSAMAARALIEGEAALHQSRYAAAVLGIDGNLVDWPARLQNEVDRGDIFLLGQHYPYLSVYGVFPYTYGARFVHFAWRQNGLEGVLGLDAAPPSTTQVVMASVDQIAPAPAVVELAAPPNPPEWSLDTETTMGALGLWLALEPDYITDLAQAFALAWRGDRLWVFTDAPSVAVVWKIALSNDANAEKVASAFGDQARVERRSNLVVLAVSDAMTPLDWAFE